MFKIKIEKMAPISLFDGIEYHGFFWCTNGKYGLSGCFDHFVKKRQIMVHTRTE